MFNEIVCYRCYCAKCSHSWTTKDKTLPQTCAGCRSKLWNIDYIDRNTGEVIEDVRVIAPDDRQVKLAALRELIAPIEIVAVEVADEWQGWTEPAQTYDDQTGEMRTYRRHVKTGKVRWLDSASYQSGV